MSKSGLDVLTIGDSSLDLYMTVESGAMFETETPGELPKVCFFHGAKIAVDKFQTSIAGNALNVAVATKILGLKTSIYTEIGKDENSKRLKEELVSYGVDTTYIVENEGTATDVHSIIVFSGERTIFSYHGKRKYSLKTWPKPKCLYYTSLGKGFEGFQDELVAYLKKSSEIMTVFNPGTFQLLAGIENLKPILQVTHVLIVNKEEARMLTSNEDMDTKQCHIALQKLGPKLTVITDAERGSSAFDGETYLEQGLYSDERPVVDKTGAGDAFSAGFIAALLYGKPLDQALKWGAINSSNQIKVIGSIDGLLDKNSIEKISNEIK